MKRKKAAHAGMFDIAETANRPMIHIGGWGWTRVTSILEQFLGKVFFKLENISMTFYLLNWLGTIFALFLFISQLIQHKKLLLTARMLGSLSRVDPTILNLLSKNCYCGLTEKPFIVVFFIYWAIVLFYQHVKFQ